MPEFNSAPLLSSFNTSTAGNGSGGISGLLVAGALTLTHLRGRNNKHRKGVVAESESDSATSYTSQFLDPETLRHFEQLQAKLTKRYRILYGKASLDEMVTYLEEHNGYASRLARYLGVETELSSSEIDLLEKKIAQRRIKEEKIRTKLSSKTRRAEGITDFDNKKFRNPPVNIDIKRPRYLETPVSTNTAIRLTDSRGLHSGSLHSPSVITLTDASMVFIWADTYSSTPIQGKILYADGSVRNTQLFIARDFLYQPLLAALPDGGFVVIWVSTIDTPPYSYKIVAYGQVFEADGTKRGAEFVVNSSPIRTKNRPSLAILSNGKLVVAWENSNTEYYADSRLRFQIFEANGTKYGTVIHASSSAGYLSDPSVTALSNGNFLLHWCDHFYYSTIRQYTPVCNIYTQIFDSTGRTIGREFLLNSLPEDNFNTASASFLALANGKFVGTWTKYNSATNGSATYGQIFDADGISRVPKLHLRSAPNIDIDQGLILLSDGSFVACGVSVWSEVYTARGIYCQNYQANGVPKTTLLEVSQVFSVTVLLTKIPLKDSRYALTWMAPDIHGQVLEANGTKINSEFNVAVTEQGTRRDFSRRRLINNDFILVWAEEERTYISNIYYYSTGIYVERFNNGIRVSINGLPPSPSPTPTLTSSGTGTHTSTPSNTATHTPTPSKTATPSGTPSPTPSSSAPPDTKFEVARVDSENAIISSAILPLINMSFIAAWARRSAIYGCEVLVRFFDIENPQKSLQFELARGGFCSVSLTTNALREGFLITATGGLAQNSQQIKLVYQQAFAYNLTKLGEPLQIITNISTPDAEMTRLSDDRVVIRESGPSTSVNSSIYEHFYDHRGQTARREALAYQSYLLPLASPHGSYIRLWGAQSSTDPINNLCCAKIFYFDGTSKTASFQISSDNEAKSLAFFKAFPGGDFVFVLAIAQGSSRFKLEAQFYSADGTARGASIRLANLSTAALIQGALLTNNQLALAWNDGLGTNIQLFNSLTAANQSYIWLNATLFNSMASLPSGGFLINGYTKQNIAQLFRSNGTAISRAFLIHPFLNASMQAILSDGSLIFVMGSATRIYGQWIGTDGTRRALPTISTSSENNSLSNGIIAAIASGASVALLLALVVIGCFIHRMRSRPSANTRMEEEQRAAAERLAEQERRAAAERLAAQERRAAAERLAAQERRAAAERLAEQERRAAAERLAEQERRAAAIRRAEQERLAAEREAESHRIAHTPAEISAEALTINPAVKLGEGGFATVYAGLFAGRGVAFKAVRTDRKGIPRTAAEIREIEEILSNEAAIHKRIYPDSSYETCNTIVKLNGICRHPTKFGLVIELMWKETLGDIFKNREIPKPVILIIALHVLQALQHIHVRGFLHRDLKSANVLIDNNMNISLDAVYPLTEGIQAKLSDFGLAVAKDPISQSFLGPAEYGTLDYLAPELISRSGTRSETVEYTEQSDVYSFGLILAEMFARVVPFQDVRRARERRPGAGAGGSSAAAENRETIENNTIRSIIARSRESRFPDYRPTEDIENILTRCWRLRNTDRPSAAEVIELLRPLMTRGR